MDKYINYRELLEILELAKEEVLQKDIRAEDKLLMLYATEETKNGRLIDADALAKKVENAYKFAIGEVRQAYSFILDLIADAPTIPAPKPEDAKK